jgi:superfamily I DNA and/or RNA helicase
MAYTNRAVDEICSMLENAGIDYLRIGNMYSADDSFHKHFIDNIVSESLKLNDIKQKIIDKKVVVGTTSSIQSHTYLFEIKCFTLTVVDEASQILEPNIIGLLNKNRFILIGDYKQLPAVVQQDANVSAVNDKQLNDICLTNCRDSLFERLIKVERKAGRKQFIGVLRKQGRMHPDVADFPNKMFYASECLEPVPCPHQKENDLHYDKPSEDMLDDVLKKRRMIFIPSEPCGQTNLSDNVNPNEAKIVADLLRRIYRFTEKHFDPDKTVGVIIPYRNQIAMIRNEIEKLNLPALKRISIDTIERYQGSQRDVIIFSFTVQHRYQLDFLTNNCFEENGRIIDRKLNVALTRARCQMIMTGNRETLLYNNIYKQLIENYIV